MQTTIRPYKPTDLDALYRICLQTGDSGKDATALYNDPKLLGHFYAAPYAVLEPELCFVVTCSGKPCGYILGTKDSQDFSKNCEKKWFPELRRQYAFPAEDDSSFDARIIRLIHQGHIVKNDLLEYPAHLHIDLLPQTQGQGIGRKLIAVFKDELRAMGVPALHLEVGKTNVGAIKFYKKTGFHVIKEYEKSVVFGVEINN